MTQAYRFRFNFDCLDGLALAQHIDAAIATSDRAHILRIVDSFTAYGDRGATQFYGLCDSRAARRDKENLVLLSANDKHLLRLLVIDLLIDPRETSHIVVVSELHRVLELDIVTLLVELFDRDELSADTRYGCAIFPEVEKLFGEVIELIIGGCGQLFPDLGLLLGERHIRKVKFLVWVELFKVIQGILARYSDHGQAGLLVGLEEGRDGDRL